MLGYVLEAKTVAAKKSVDMFEGQEYTGAVKDVEESISSVQRDSGDTIVGAHLSDKIAAGEPTAEVDSCKHAVAAASMPAEDVANCSIAADGVVLGHAVVVDCIG